MRLEQLEHVPVGVGGEAGEVVDADPGPLAGQEARHVELTAGVFDHARSLGVGRLTAKLELGTDGEFGGGHGRERRESAPLRHLAGARPLYRLERRPV